MDMRKGEMNPCRVPCHPSRMGLADVVLAHVRVHLEVYVHDHGSHQNPR